MKDGAELTPEARLALRAARRDVERGWVYTTQQLIRELGIW